MDLDIKNKIVVVTGGSKGIGLEIVKTFLNEGAIVHFCSRNNKSIQKSLSELDELGEVYGKSIDVKNKGEFSKWIREIGKIDIFIPNVSALSDNWAEAIEIDLMSTINNIKSVIPHMKSPDCAVTYIGSVASDLPTAGAEAYGPIKSAMTHYIKSLSLTYAKKIRFNIVSPGSVIFDNGLWDEYRKSNPKEYSDKEENLPLGRLMTTREVANVVVFISSPLSSYITGSNILVNGGEVVV